MPTPGNVTGGKDQKPAPVSEKSGGQGSAPTYRCRALPDVCAATIDRFEHVPVIERIADWLIIVGVVLIVIGMFAGAA